MHKDVSGSVVKKERLKPTTQKLLADAPPRLNCLEVWFHPKLLGCISKSYIT